MGGWLDFEWVWVGLELICISCAAGLGGGQRSNCKRDQNSLHHTQSNPKAAAKPAAHPTQISSKPTHTHSKSRLNPPNSSLDSLLGRPPLFDQKGNAKSPLLGFKNRKALLLARAGSSSMPRTASPEIASASARKKTEAHWKRRRQKGAQEAFLNIYIYYYYYYYYYWDASKLEFTQPGPHVFWARGPQHVGVDPVQNDRLHELDS